MPDKKCNFPECPNDASSRGLCTKHNWQARNAADPAVREKAAGCMDPPKRGGARRKPAAAQSQAPAKAPTVDDETGRVIHDDAVAAVHEFAAFMGIKGVHLEEGILYVNRATGKAALMDRETGKLEEAQIFKGANRLRIV